MEVLATLAGGWDWWSFIVSVAGSRIEHMFETDRFAVARDALARAETAAGLRSRLDASVVPLPAGLESLLPGGLTRGSVLGIRGSTSVTLAVMAAAMGSAGWAAVVGRGDLGWVAASEAGVDLARVVHVPRPGPAAADVVAACVDGFDVVVLGDAVDLGPGARRSLLGRIRSHGTVVLAAWPGVPMLRATVHGGDGCDGGAGHVRGRSISVRREGMPAVVVLRMESRPAPVRRGHLQAVS